MDVADEGSSTATQEDGFDCCWMGIEVWRQDWLFQVHWNVEWAERLVDSLSPVSPSSEVEVLCSRWLRLALRIVRSYSESEESLFTRSSTKENHQNSLVRRRSWRNVVLKRRRRRQEEIDELFLNAILPSDEVLGRSIDVDSRLTDWLSPMKLWSKAKSICISVKSSNAKREWKNRRESRRVKRRENQQWNVTLICPPNIKIVFVMFMTLTAANISTESFVSSFSFFPSSSSRLFSSSSGSVIGLYIRRREREREKDFSH